MLDNVNSGAANPYGLAISKDGSTLYVTHTGIHKVSVINLPRLHELLKKTPPEMLAQTAIALGFLWGGKGDIIRRVDCGGLGPKGVAVSPADGSVFVANYFSDDIAVLDAKTAAVVTTIPLGPAQDMTQERRGEFLFHSALHCFQNWLSCTSCHPDVRADGVNWDLMNDGITNPKNAKSLVGAWQTPPAMWLGVRKDMETAVEKGFLFIQFHNVSKEDKAAVAAFLRSVQFIPSPFHRNPDGSLDEQAKRGKKVFEKAKCIACHMPPLYTDLKMYNVGTRGERDLRVAVEDLEKPTETKADPAQAPAQAKPQTTDVFDTPTLLEMYRTGPYLHDGRAATLEEVLTTFNKNDRHGETSKLSPQEIDDLIAFLMTL
jgi:YVTN family beta-propeller protein